MKRVLQKVRKDGEYRFPWIEHQQLKGKSALLISERPRSWRMFQTVDALGHVDIPYKKYLKRTLYFYKGVGYRPEQGA